MTKVSNKECLGYSSKLVNFRCQGRVLVTWKRSWQKYLELNTEWFQSSKKATTITKNSKKAKVTLKAFSFQKGVLFLGLVAN